jgi:dienelactone hydrolase
MNPYWTLNCEHLSARIRIIEAQIPVSISLPRNARGLILFGDGVAKGKDDPVQHQITEMLNEHGWATVLADLIFDEERTVNPHSGELCCGLDLLESRVVALTDWVAMQSNLQALPLGYFGVGFGAEAALIAATKRPEMIRAVAACGPELEHVECALRDVCVPTLLIFGNGDPIAVDRQRTRLGRLPEKTPRELILIGNAMDPLDEEGVKERVVSLAQGWYERYLVA